MRKKMREALKVTRPSARTRKDARPVRFVPTAVYHQMLRTAGWAARSDDFTSVAIEAGEADDGVFHFLQTPDPRSWLDRVAPPDLGRVRAFLQRRAEGVLEYRLALPQGGDLWIRHCLLPAPKKSAWLRGVLQAIPEQKRLEDDCLRVSERERTRIGQELHDDICQVLAGLTYMMRVIGRRGAEQGAALPPEFAELNECLVTAMNRTRAMAHGLFPSQLVDGTLPDALHGLAHELKTRFDFALTVKASPRLPLHAGDQVMHVFRIAQEAMANAIRHGGATAGEAAIRVLPGDVEIFLSDNGRGLTAERPAPGLGLQTMRHRAQLLGGTLELGNRSEGGAFVRLLYPLPAGVRRSQKAA